MSDTAMDFYEQGHRLALDGKFSGALAAFDQALREKLDFAEAHTGRAVCLKMLGRTAEAEKAFALAKAMGDANLPAASEPAAAGQAAQYAPDKQLGMKWFYWTVFAIYPSSSLMACGLIWVLKLTKALNPMILAVLSFSILLSLYVAYALYKRKGHAWVLHLVLTGLNVAIMPLDNLNKPRGLLVASLTWVIGGLYFWLNYVYFYKRKHLFK